MMDVTIKNEWQFLDNEIQMLYPHFTMPFLQCMARWSFADKDIFEWGSGHSTAWFAMKCRSIRSVEEDATWANDVEIYTTSRDNRTAIFSIKHIPLNVGEVPMSSPYVMEIYKAKKLYDIIIVDGAYRDACFAAALNCIKDGGIIICDNWKQELVWESSVAERLANPFYREIYLQPDHAPNYEERWKTAWFKINKMKPHLFKADEGYYSHRPLLWLALENTNAKLPVYEFGVGIGSTNLLSQYCQLQERLFCSYEANPEWKDIFHVNTPVNNYDDVYIDDAGVIFVDHAPCERRKTEILRFKDACEIMVVHDTEPEHEHLYQFNNLLNSFQSRVDLICPGEPWTSAVSNKKDLSFLKGIQIGKYIVK